jgi:hypothetical protein
MVPAGKRKKKIKEIHQLEVIKKYARVEGDAPPLKEKIKTHRLEEIKDKEINTFISSLIQMSPIPKTIQ